MSKNVIELIRVSTHEQSTDDHASIPAQMNENQRTADRFGLRIVKTISIVGASGAKVSASPQMLELLKLIESPEIHGVVTREFSRLMRPDRLEDWAILQSFCDTNTLLYTPDGPSDLATFQGRMMGSIRALIAGEERQEMKRRVFTAKEERRKQGKSPQSRITLPYGVGFDPRKGYFYEAGASNVKLAFDKVLQGETSYREIGRIVGVPASTLRLALRNPIYNGWRVYDMKRDLSSAGLYAKDGGRQADRRKIKRGHDEIIRVRVIEQPLVTQDEFDQVQHILQTKRFRHWRTRPGYTSRFLYRGFLTCARCGAVVHTRLANRDYYVCSGRSSKKCLAPYMDRLSVEKTLDHLISRKLTSRAFLKACLKHATSAVTNDGHVRRLQEAIGASEARSARVLDAYVSGVMTADDRDRRLAEVKKHIETLQRELDQQLSGGVVTEDSLVDAFSALYDWRRWAPEQKRRILTCMSIGIALSRDSENEISVSSVVSNVTHTGKDSSPPAA